jgi:large subunit ribosomal protein L5
MSFKENYIKKILPEIQKELGIENPMELPRIEKIVLNMGIGTYVAAGNKDFSSLKNDLALISGQLPRVLSHVKLSLTLSSVRICQLV